MQNNILALVRNIKIKCTFDDAVVLDLKAISHAEKIVKNSKLRTNIILNSGFVYKKSVDARDKDNIILVYTIAFKLKSVINQSIKGIDILETPDIEKLFCVNNKPTCPPVVVGFGPAGMFCALALAKAGLNPVVIERGSDVEKRSEAVKAYWENGIIDKNTNVQFGEGGAGTFSDGKLLTRISDKLCNYVLSTFTEFGAPAEIMYLAKPHIGTDNLRRIVKNIRQEIINLGGTVKFNSCLTGVHFENNKADYIILDSGEYIKCDSLFLCIGHSARDTVKFLMKCGIKVEPKPFSVGVRIEHLQSDIDESLLGSFASCPCIGPAQYTLSRKVGGRAVYSFCMCPGGIVVASASDENQIVTNGMSFYARDGKNANSAIAVSVDTADYGNTVEGAVSFQESIERRAFDICGGDGTAPIQLVGDFLNDTCCHEPSRILPTYTGKTAVRRADDVFPLFITNSLRNGISMFEKDIAGFTVNDAVLTFPETRTSSPVKMPRDKDYLAEGFVNVYPCGEGAGYAGGITSAAVDGLRAAVAYIKKQGS